MTALASNRIGDLAGRIRQAQDRARAASVDAAERYFEAGRLLLEAKAECRHGEWGAFLEAAGVHERQARRLMQLARSGLKPDTVSEMGLRGALESLARKKVGEEQHAGEFRDTLDRFRAHADAQLAEAERLRAEAIA